LMVDQGCNTYHLWETATTHYPSLWRYYLVSCCIIALIARYEYCANAMKELRKMAFFLFTIKIIKNFNILYFLT
jgi:hypothetical protein